MGDEGIKLERLGELIMDDPNAKGQILESGIGSGL